jgi:hypothetical protein
MWVVLVSYYFTMTRNKTICADKNTQLLQNIYMYICIIYITNHSKYLSLPQVFFMKAHWIYLTPCIIHSYSSCTHVILLFSSNGKISFLAIKQNCDINNETQNMVRECIFKRQEITLTWVTSPAQCVYKCGHFQVTAFFFLSSGTWI